jgi:hypothetical protein
MTGSGAGIFVIDRKEEGSSIFANGAPTAAAAAVAAKRTDIEGNFFCLSFSSLSLFLRRFSPLALLAKASSFASRHFNRREERN